MSAPPPGDPVPLATDGYPAASGVARRDAGAAESARANRRWWDAAAPAYLAEHGHDLGDVDFLWCPEGLREEDAHLLGDVVGRRVLEIGCGSAPCSRWLRRAGGEPIGLDLSGGMLTRAAALNTLSGVAVPLVQGDAGALPLADASVDVVVSNLAIHNIPTREGRRRALAEAVRVLRPGGRLAIADLWEIRGHAAQLREIGWGDVRWRSLGWRMWYGGPWAATRLVSGTKPS
jgi:SAM-dependent methyltransferase